MHEASNQNGLYACLLWLMIATVYHRPIWSGGHAKGAQLPAAQHAVTTMSHRCRLPMFSKVLTVQNMGYPGVDAYTAGTARGHISDGEKGWS